MNDTRPGASAERNRERARRKNRSNSSAISRIFPRTKAASAPAHAAATGSFILRCLLRGIIAHFYGTDRGSRKSALQSRKSSKLSAPFFFLGRAFFFGFFFGFSGSGSGSSASGSGSGSGSASGSGSGSGSGS